MSKPEANTGAVVQIRQEISALEAEIRVFRDKCEVEEKVLAILIAQRMTLLDPITRGTMKSAAAALNERIYFSKAALEGFDNLLRETTKRLEEAYAKLRTLEEALPRTLSNGPV